MSKPHLLTGVGHLEVQDVDSSTGRLKTETFGAAGKPVLIMMYGSYCGHCKQAAPAFKKVHAEHKQSKLFMCALQTDDNNPATQQLMKFFPQVLKKNGVSFNGVPTYILYQNGKYSEFRGGRDEASLRKLISSL